MTATHRITVAGYTDETEWDVVQLCCSCGWMSDEFDSKFFTIDEVVARAAGHTEDITLPTS